MNFFSQKNRILLKELIKTDFKLRYQGSFIGYLWSILKPLMMFTIMYLVFVRFLRFDDGTPHYAVGLLLAMIFWGFFTEATNMGMLSIVSRGDLLRKLNFPKQTIVISSVLGAAINFLINLVVVFVFALINHVPIGFNTLVIIPLFIEVLLMAMGVAFIGVPYGILLPRLPSPWSSTTIRAASPLAPLLRKRTRRHMPVIR